MDKLYAPWRDNYVQGHVKQGKHVDEKCCIFCDVFLVDTNKILEDRFVLYKDHNVAVMLNLYPYNGGHLLVFARHHVEQFYDIPSDVQNCLMHAISQSMRIVKQALGCDGINFGANVGRLAGAGIPQHVHMHIVPRWQGDTGFLTIIGETKQISVDLEKIYKQLKCVFDKEFIGENI